MAAPRSIGQKIHSLHEQGMSYRDITKELGCSKGTVAYHLGHGQKTKYAESSKRTREARYERYYRLKEGPCVDCGKKFPPFVMHFDHLGVELKFKNVSWLICNMGWEKVLEEIEKCELVCSNCHGLRTIRRSIESGSASSMMVNYYKEYTGVWENR